MEKQVQTKRIGRQARYPSRILECQEHALAVFVPEKRPGRFAPRSFVSVRPVFTWDELDMIGHGSSVSHDGSVCGQKVDVSVDGQ